MSELRTDILDRPVKYSGDQISVRSLEDGIREARERQNVRVEELQVLRERNVELQKALADEVSKLRKLSDYVATGKSLSGFWSNLKEILSFVPGLGGVTERSVEELLRQQYEISTRRVKEAGEFAERLRAAESDLHDEIERLNQKIVSAAKNEDLAAAYVLELNALKLDLERQLAEVGADSTKGREVQALLDRQRRTMSEHSTALQLYGTAEGRLDRLKDNTRRLSETIASLASDITQYVQAASEKLDLVAGQLQAIGTAADASVIMLEMKKSLDSMTQSMNETTRFVSETQMYFRNNLDNLVKDLELYDDETRSVMDKNLERSKAIEEERIDDAVKAALERRQARAAQ